MTIDLLLANFDRLADAPNGIPKLRELIFQLAVRGKLVPQDPNDEPASELLKRIRIEKQRLIADGEIRKPKPLPLIDPDEIRYVLPRNWEWARLGEWGDWGAGATPNRSRSEYFDGEIPWFKSGELGDSEQLRDSEEHVTDLALQECSLRVDRPGDVLIAMYGATIGKLAVLEVKATTNQAVCACTSFPGIFNRYLFLVLRAYRPEFTRKGAGGAQPNISKVKIVNTPAALPSLAEQKRIVAKVDELRALCNKLEAKQQAKRTKQIALNRASLHALTQPDGTSLAAAWHRVRDQFDNLYSVPETVTELRQTILQLAVMGRLVPQDPNDEPASEILKRIKAEKEQLIKKGRIRKTKAPQTINPDLLPWELPQGWTWSRTADMLLSVSDGDHQPPPRSNDGVPFLVIGNVSSGALDFAETRYVPRAYYDQLDPIRVPRTGDVLYTVTGSYGITVVVDTEEEFCVQRHIAILKVPSLISPKFISTWLNSPLAIEQAAAGATGTAQKTVALGTLRNLQLPLPPLAEQKRIVAKVNKLMALCDDLETELTQAQRDADNLLSAIVYELIT